MGKGLFLKKDSHVIKSCTGRSKQKAVKGSLKRYSKDPQKGVLCVKHFDRPIR